MFLPRIKLVALEQFLRVRSIDRGFGDAELAPPPTIPSEILSSLASCRQRSGSSAQITRLPIATESLRQKAGIVTLV